MLLCSTSFQFTWEYFFPQKTFSKPKTSLYFSPVLPEAAFPGLSDPVCCVWQLGTLGAGNHYAEIQVVDEIYNEYAAKKMGIDHKGQVCVMIHSGSRGLGHQVATGMIWLATGVCHLEWGKLFSMVLSLTANSSTKEHFLQRIAESILNCLVGCYLFANNW